MENEDWTAITLQEVTYYVMSPQRESEHLFLTILQDTFSCVNRENYVPMNNGTQKSLSELQHTKSKSKNSTEIKFLGHSLTAVVLMQ